MDKRRGSLGIVTALVSIFVLIIDQMTTNDVEAGVGRDGQNILTCWTRGTSPSRQCPRREQSLCVS